MDFWTHQEGAKRNTFWLILLYTALLLGFSLLAAFVIDLAWGMIYPKASRYSDWYLLIRYRFPLVFAAFPLLVGIMTLFSPASLSTGGRGVAEAMEGTLVQPQTKNNGERRLLNVVEEMAIASGVPVPPVYVLQQEGGINAFAAGATVHDAVIGVTRGTIEYLDRSELQAVIAHEFSHILNGDMRLNLRFARLLFGLVCLAEVGGLILRGMRGGRSSKNDKGKGLIIIIALVCYLTGLVLACLGRILQAAINRQREFLADASSVQFTRTTALASALKKIGGLSQGSRISDTSLVGNYSHFFFSQTSDGLLSTHPSLAARIKRLEPDWNGIFPIPALVQDDPADDARRDRITAWTTKDFGLARPVFSHRAGMAGASEATEPPAAIESGPLLSGTALLAGQAENSLLSGDESPLGRGDAHALRSGTASATATLTLKPTTEDQARAKLRAASREPLDACYLVFALLLDAAPNVREKQLAGLASAERRETILDYKRAVDLLPRDEYLPLIELAVPALKMLSDKQYAVFHAAMRQYIQADEVFSFKEWILYQLISSQVGAQYGSKAGLKPSYARARESSVTLLAALAWLKPDQISAGKTFIAGLRAMQLPVRPLPVKPKVEALIPAMDVLRRASELVRENFIIGAEEVLGHNTEWTEEESMVMRLLLLCLGKR